MAQWSGGYNVGWNGILCKAVDAIQSASRRQGHNIMAHHHQVLVTYYKHDTLWELKVQLFKHLAFHTSASRLSSYSINPYAIPAPSFISHRLNSP
jgi:hypothetical protein